MTQVPRLAVNTETRRTPAPRIALTKDEAAQALGMSVGSLNKYVLPDVKVIRRGTIVLIPVKQLETWAERSADYTI